MATGDKYSISIQAVANTQQATQAIDSLAASTDKVGAASLKSSGGVDQLDNTISDLRAQMKDLTGAAQPAAISIETFANRLFIGAVAVLGAIKVITALVERIQQYREEQERANLLADRLELPIDKVKSYSEKWLEVAVSLNEAARGFDNLSDSQKRAFDALGVNPGAAGAADAVKTRVAAMSGTRQEKVDVLRILTGLSAEDAAKELDRELDRLAERTSTRTNRRTTRGDAEGVAFGAEDAGQLLRSNQLVGPARLKEIEQGRKELDALQKARVAGQKQASEEIEKIVEKENKAAIKAASERIDALAEGGRIARELNQAVLDGIESDYDAVADQTRELLNQLDRDFKVINDNLVQESENAARSFKENLTDPITAGLDSLVARGKFSAGALVKAVTTELLKKQLYDAIAKLGDALARALNPSGSGTGALGKIANSALGAVFGRAGGGEIDRPTIVGEDGPELFVPGRAGKIINARQLAFGGGRSDRGAAPPVVYAPQYSISGVETESVIAYIERTRRQDQQAMQTSLYNNGFGRLR